MSQKPDFEAILQAAEPTPPMPVQRKYQGEKSDDYSTYFVPEAGLWVSESRGSMSSSRSETRVPTLKVYLTVGKGDGDEDHPYNLRAENIDTVTAKPGGIELKHLDGTVRAVPFDLADKSQEIYFTIEDLRSGKPTTKINIDNSAEPMQPMHFSIGGNGITGETKKTPHGKYEVTLPVHNEPTYKIDLSDARDVSVSQMSAASAMSITGLTGDQAAFVNNGKEGLDGPGLTVPGDKNIRIKRDGRGTLDAISPDNKPADAPTQSQSKSR